MKLLGLAATALLAACSGGDSPLLSLPAPNLQAQLGDANPDLPDARLQAFARGKAVFGRVFTRALSLSFFSSCCHHS